MSELVTGEAVPLEVRLAKLPSRALAFLLDLFVLVVVGVPLLGIVTAVVVDADEALGAALLLVGLVTLVVGVPVTVETASGGRSLGKLALGLRVVRDDGGPIRFRHSLTRGLAGVFVDFYLTSGAGAVICSILNERGKRVGDLLAGTVVVRERTPSPGAGVPPVPPQLAGWATGLELSRLPDQLALAARTYFSRSPQLSARVRDELGAQLATEVAGYISPPAPPGTPAWAYLAAVLGERSRRETLRWRAAHSEQRPAPGAERAGSRPSAAPPEQAAAPPREEPPPPSPGGFAPPS